MDKTTAALILTILLIVGCSHDSPIAVDIEDQFPLSLAQAGIDSDRHILWGEWELIFDETHSIVDAVPQRTARFHLNSTKFLESTCTDCLNIVSLQNNGDGTIDLKLRIQHPFNGHPELTGFDVKGIIMFIGSHTMNLWADNIFPYYDKVRVSWKEKGDPELLNADGYSPRWSPWWDSGSSMPMFSYWPGKYSGGTPTANINAYINFYTDEQRHMFRSNGAVERTYHIWLPPGPVTAGYAVEACWEPPAVTPVTDPITDFPVSANQEEPYFFRYVVNNGEVIKEDPCCGFDRDCEDLHVEVISWDGIYQDDVQYAGVCLLPPPYDSITGMGGTLYICDNDPSGDPVWLNPSQKGFSSHEGTFRGVAILYRSVWKYPYFYTSRITYTVFDFTVDLD